MNSHIHNRISSHIRSLLNRKNTILLVISVIFISKKNVSSFHKKKNWEISLLAETERGTSLFLLLLSR